VIFESAGGTVVEVSKQDSDLAEGDRADTAAQERAQALARIKSHGRRLPVDWNFKRDEANAR
jgi:hypothetical protein